MSNVSFEALLTAVESHASNYESALLELETSASSSAGDSGPGSVNITDATVATTRVQLTQSLNLCFYCKTK